MFTETANQHLQPRHRGVPPLGRCGPSRSRIPMSRERSNTCSTTRTGSTPCSGTWRISSATRRSTPWPRWPSSAASTSPTRSVPTWWSTSIRTCSTNTGTMEPRPGAQAQYRDPGVGHRPAVDSGAQDLPHGLRSRSVPTSDDAHRAACRKKLDVLLAQQADLSRAIEELIGDIEAGRKYMKTYKQMKMYNDPALNPVLYGQKK